MSNKPKKLQDARLSTEAVMTHSPVSANNSTSLSANKPAQIIDGSIDKPISNAHKDYDTDLARDNLENDNTAADIQDL
jgi:hypothetical protein